MLSLFPEILFLAPVSALLLRLALACVLGYAAWKHVSHEESVVRAFSVFEIATAGVLIAGVWTQGAAIAALAVIAIHVAIPRLRTAALGTTLLSLAISLSLVVTGAGALAFDLPL